MVATADFRGLFASYGHNEGNNRGEWMTSAQYDAYDITEWLAEQPWSDGNIGMWGCSATGGSQMQAITTDPPHLKAIFPMSFEFDIYDFRVAGGITGARGGVTPQKPGDLTPQQKRDAQAVPVSTDTDSVLLKNAIAEHGGTIEGPGYLPFKNSKAETFIQEDAKEWWVKSSPVSYLDKINASGIAMYMAVNWNEGYTKPGPFFAFNNFETPRKLLLGPGAHCDWNETIKRTGFDVLVEERRFFDYWLKGIDNGIMEEEPVYYFTYNAAEGEEWKSAKAWPLPNEKRKNFYLTQGGLDINVPLDKNGKDEATVSYKRNNEDVVLTYQTEALKADVQVTGHPVMHLWISSTATDGDFIATVSDIAPDGTIESYNVQGQLKASMRKTAIAPYDNLGLPYHSFLESEVVYLTPEKPAKLEFALLPISMIFKKDHKLQLEISFVARGTSEIKPAPKVTVYRNEKHPSFLTLPIIE